MRCCLALLLIVTVASASAQQIHPPGEIVIYVNGDVRNTEFVEPLVCEVSKVVRAPVRAKKIDIALTGDLLETPRQYSPRRIVPKFVAATMGESQQPDAFTYLLVDHDLTVPGLNYVFAETYLPPVSVISVVRLAPTVEPHAAKKAAEITMPRVYKLMLKSVAFMAGLRSSGCVMATPRSLPELDAKPSDYCTDDRAALVAAKVIKETPSATCGNVVSAR